MSPKELGQMTYLALCTPRPALTERQRHSLRTLVAKEMGGLAASPRDARGEAHWELTAREHYTALVEAMR